MKPQDLLVALALVRDEQDDLGYARLAARVRLSTSETYAAVRRLQNAGLVSARRELSRTSLLEFLLHGVRFTFPARPGEVSLGVPTGAAAPALKETFPAPDPVAWVWPSPSGTERGLSLEPLYESVPLVAQKDPALYELLALVDALRAGRARDRAMARERLEHLITPKAFRRVAPVGSVDLSSPDGLREIFSIEKLTVSLRRMTNRRERAREDEVTHPLFHLILTEYREQLAELLAALVPAGRFAPAPATRVLVAKNASGFRELVFPAILDTVVARRLVDELETSITKDDGTRTFFARSHFSANRKVGEYDGVGPGGWMAFSRSVDAAAQSGFAYAFRTDIADFFASIDRALARQLLAQRSGAHRAVIDLVFACLEAWLPTVDYARGSGIPVEPNDLSRVVAHAFVKSVDEQFKDGDGVAYRRFMDDTVILVESRAEAERVRLRHHEVLRAHGLTPRGAKTEVASVEELRAFRRADDHRALTEIVAADDTKGLQDFARRWMNDKERNGEWFRIAKRVYTACERMRLETLRSRAVADAAAVPEIRREAFRYLRALPLDSKDLDRLVKAFGDGGVGQRIEIAKTLANGSFSPPDSERVAAAASRIVRQADPLDGAGYARGSALLALFKHGTRADRDVVRTWAHVSELTDPQLRLHFVYVFLCTDELDEPLRSGLRFAGGDDFELMVRLVSDARAYRLRNVGSVLRNALQISRKQKIISAAHLPFLRALFEGAANQKTPREQHEACTTWIADVLGDRAVTLRDEVVRAHLEEHARTLKR